MENSRFNSFFIALILTLFASLVGRYLAHLPYLSVLGGMILSLLIGVLYQLYPKAITNSKEGTSFISSKFLRAGIILFGFKLNVDTLIATGKQSILLAIFVVAFTTVVIYTLARAFKIEKNLSLLVAIGCAVCGAAAVMAITPQIKAKSEQSVLAVSIVAVLGTIFTILEVVIKPYLGFTDAQFGILAGASLHEIAHTVAAGSSVSDSGLDIAIITKLSRVLLLVPVAILVKMFYVKNTSDDAGVSVPWFLFGFLATSLLGTYTLLGEYAVQLADFGTILLGMAMAALGMSANVKYILNHGLKVFGIATIGSTILLVACLLIIKLFM